MRTLSSSLAIVLIASAVHAERLFVPAAGVDLHVARGISRVRSLAIDPAALARLRTDTAVVLEDFPLGADGAVVLDLERFEPFTTDAHVEVVEAKGKRTIALPDHRYFRGVVRGAADSHALLIAASDGVRGFVAARGTVYRFGRDRTGIHRSYALRDVDPSQFPTPQRLCDNDEHAALVAPRHGRGLVVSPEATPPALGFSPTLLAEVAIETDQELRGKFSSDAEATDYLTDLAAAMSSIYDTDTNVRVRFNFIRLWDVADPWAATSTTGMLSELETYWNANEVGTPRDTVHFVSGKAVVGGLAYLGVLCDPAFGYGVSTVYGSFDVMNPTETWDVVVTSHELGHNFGSVHTHCYVPPVDDCYNGEAGCYGGPESLPPGGGTIMSYCHQLPGGIANVNLTFGATVAAVLRAGAESGVCIGPPCPDGIVDPGEDCDDGNYVAGDCCSPTCTADPDGGSCDDGNACTGGETCSAGACVGSAVVDGSPCDDGNGCTDDGCVSGACLGTAAPASGCKQPIQPLASLLQFKDKTPDSSDSFGWKFTKGDATTPAELGDPLTSDDYTFCVYGSGPTLLFAARVPAGGTCVGVPCWKVTSTGYGYKDKDRTPDGVGKLGVSSGGAGATKAKAKGKGTLLSVPTLGALPLPLTAQLRGPGACFEATYSTPITNTTEQFKAKSD